VQQTEGIVLSELCLSTVAAISSLIAVLRLLHLLRLARRVLHTSSEQVELEPDVPSEVVSSAPSAKGIGPKEPMQSSYLDDLIAEIEELEISFSSDPMNPRPGTLDERE
jgi:hypothetical protein